MSAGTEHSEQGADRVGEGQSSRGDRGVEVDLGNLLDEVISCARVLPLDIVQAKAKGYDLSLSPEELEVRALRWSIERGNFSGRAAEQLLEHLASEGLARKKAEARP